MADQADFDEDTSTRNYVNAHSGKHPIPTIQGYRQHRRELDSQLEDEEQAQQGPEDQSRTKRAYDSAKAAFKDENDAVGTHHEPHPSANRNYADRPTQHDYEQASENKDATQQESDSEPGDRRDQGREEDKDNQQDKTATEAVAGAIDPKEKRKAMKKTKRHGKGREVTDPVTHLPIIIHDQTDKDLQEVPENEPEPGGEHHTATGPQGASKSDLELDAEQKKLQRGYNGMQRLFPTPDFEYTKQELAAVYQQAVSAGLGAIGLLAAVLLVLPGSLSGEGLVPHLSTVLGVILFLFLGGTIALGMGKWVHKKSTEVFEDETWDAARRQEQAILDDNEELPESVQWLNSLFAAIWPLVNPDLFASVVDMIEDIMQASLPKMVKMVSVDDMGQGSESIRILGVRWLPTGAASRSVESDGQLHKGDKKTSDRTDPESAQQDIEESDDDASKKPAQNNEEGKDPKQQEQEQVTIREGMEAEEGDFVNMELAIAYRSRSSGKSLRAKAKNAHLYLKFYLPGGVAVPVWVELRGIIMTLRLRLQLTPDPPFISLCTLTFLGQPKASLSCVPLSKHSLNLMDVPLISSFVQSAIDAALAEYVAPKSLTINLKDMLIGEDYKKDTTSRGVVWIHIRRAVGFKQGDGGVGPTQGSSDSYVTVSWGKFGKPVASTRVIVEQNAPCWNEYASILVTPEEVNAEEKLRLQLWDSDKWTADDDLGRVEIDLKWLMKNPETSNRIQDREDRFTGQDPDEKMPGSLFWSVGYFSKTRITPNQFEQQTVNRNIKTKEQLKHHISELSERKLREANKPPDDDELHQQKIQDYREMEDAMIISAPPQEEFPSGILSVQVHNITGLEVQRLQKKDKGDGGEQEDEAEQSDDLPDSYCTIVLNHRKIFKTRTKPKNSKPFFNAGTERFIRDWRSAEVIVSVRDAREREDDPLIGIVYLPLTKVFARGSQVMENYPLVGGIGYGRARISIVWRSVELHLPPNLQGWNYGTLQIRSPVKAKEGLPSQLNQHRIKIRTNLGLAKMQPEQGQWQVKGRNGPDGVFLPVRKRYSSAMIIEFRKSVLGPDKTEAFAVLWLQDLVDEEDETKTLQVWKGGKDNIRKATSCCEYIGMGDNEQPLGEIEVNLKFWRGLSGYHKSYASHSKNADMRNVMECLDTITDEKLDSEGETDSDDDESSSLEKGSDDTREKKLRVHTNDTSSSSSEDDDDAGPDSSSDFSLRDMKKVKGLFRSPVEGATTAASAVVAPGHNDPDDGSRGLRAQIRDYKDHHKQLHRKHRGIMQWRVTREADHLSGKLSQLKGSIGGMFKHDDKDVGIETEV